MESIVEGIILELHRQKVFGVANRSRLLDWCPGLRQFKWRGSPPLRSPDPLITRAHVSGWVMETLAEIGANGEFLLAPLVISQRQTET